MLKQCFKCLVDKPRSEFYRHPQTGDGLLGKCKECTKQDMRDLRAANIEEHRDRDRKRWPKRKVSMAPRKPIDPAKRAETFRRHSEAYPEKQEARRLLGNAVRDGRVKREACFVCGNEDSEGHHEDYSRPFDVVWLCAQHHAMWHRIKREVQRVLGRPVQKEDEEHERDEEEEQQGVQETRAKAHG